MTIDATALDVVLADSDVTSNAKDKPVYPSLFDTPPIALAAVTWIEGS